MALTIGQGGSVYVGATPYPVTEWSISVQSDVQDVTSTGSTGWVEQLAGVRSADITFSAFWGNAVSALTTVFDVGTTVALVLHIGGTAATISVSAVIANATITNSAKSPVTFQCSAKSTGAAVVTLT